MWLKVLICGHGGGRGGMALAWCLGFVPCLITTVRKYDVVFLLHLCHILGWKLHVHDSASWLGGALTNLGTNLGGRVWFDVVVLLSLQVWVARMWWSPDWTETDTSSAVACEVKWTLQRKDHEDKNSQRISKNCYHHLCVCVKEIACSSHKALLNVKSWMVLKLYELDYLKLISSLLYIRGEWKQ